mmetsp:Transcript_29198/g.82381  ORF Transcript_29198/g.82381 Transcript_29198/m.82381 type:complete len:267 (-) Transcript_29198:294-1094(-)
MVPATPQDQKAELPFFGNKFCPTVEESSPASSPEDVGSRGPSPSLPADVVPSSLEDGVPTLFQCGQLFERLGGADVVSSFTPCLAGPSPECCDAVTAVVGPAGGMAYCLCNPEVEDTMFELASDWQIDNLRAYLESCPDLPLEQSGNCPKTEEVQSRLNETGLSMSELGLVQQGSAVRSNGPDVAQSPVDPPAPPPNQGSSLPAWVVPAAVVAGVVLSSLAAVAVWALVIAPAQGKARDEKLREERGKKVVSQPTIQGSASTSSEV